MSFFSFVKKRIILTLMDVGFMAAAFLLGFFVRFEGQIPGSYWPAINQGLVFIVLIGISVFILFGFYRTDWTFASVEELMKIVEAVTVTLAGVFVIHQLLGLAVPRSVYVLFWFFLLSFIGGSRLSLRLMRNHARRQNNGYNNLGSDLQESSKRMRRLIFGAGEAGVMVSQELKKLNNPKALLGFIDDDPTKRGQVIQGLPVLGTRHDIPGIVKEKNVSEIIIAAPSVSYGEIKKIINLCLQAGAKVKTVPGIYEILEGKTRFTRLREVQIEDLLKRKQVHIDTEKIAGYLTGETVLVTGAGGSIGSELCRQIITMKPRRLILFERDENNLFMLQRELDENKGNSLPVVGDVKDYHRLSGIFQDLKPDIVFHAAAYKHVPMMENNIDEAVKNNILGTKNVADLAFLHGTKRFVLVSTDKAVKPTSIMGATKRASELYILSLNNKSKTVFATVRFGNVLASRGSVVPLFKEQIERGGPVTVTHPEMMRYFMTIPEAAQLILQAGSMMEKGEVFVLDMGEPVKILDLARDMISLSGLKPDKDIKIEFIGTRPGEKLTEELFTLQEDVLKTHHERIFIARENGFCQEYLAKECAPIFQMLGDYGASLQDILFTSPDLKTLVSGDDK